MRGRLLAGVGFSVLIAACAADRASTQTPAAPSQSSSPTADVAPGEPPAMMRERAKNEIKQAEIELGQAGSDCSRACKALASMERATTHLCSVVATPDDQQSCDDAKQKLQSSRERVKGACGECQR